MDEQQYTIYWVDDEPHQLNESYKALAAVHNNEHLPWKIRFFDNADDALREFQSRKPTRPLLIWDMMMPTPQNKTGRDTMMGTRTGEWVFRAFREVYPDAPTILLTHVRDYNVLTKYGQGLNSRAANKEDVSPKMLRTWVDELLGVTESLAA